MFTDIKSVRALNFINAAALQNTLYMYNENHFCDVGSLLNNYHKITATIITITTYYCMHTKDLGLHLTLQTLRVIRIKFLLVISMVYKTEWSRELSTGPHKMNLLDILTISPYYFYRKCVGATNEN